MNTTEARHNPVQGDNHLTQAFEKRWRAMQLG